MFSDFIHKKLRTAEYKILKDGSFFGEVPGFDGVWGSGKDLESCRSDLQEVLEDWVLLKIKTGERVPGFKINFDRRELVVHA